MKLYLSLVITSMLSTSSSAFAPTHLMRASSTVSRTTTPLSMAAEDTDYVKEAMAASEKFGKTSPEARMAWELVEEMDAAKSHQKQATMIAELPEPVELAEECALPAVHEDTSEAVQNALDASKIYGKTSSEARIAWDIVEELDAANSRHRCDDIHVQKVEIPVSEKVVAPTVTYSLPTNVEEAISAALIASKIYGKTSTEARMAWELVEEMDSSTSHKKQQDEIENPKPVEVPEPEPVMASKSVHMDTSAAIKAALEASKTFGKTSVEARMAWEEVEEIDAANAHHKTVGTG